MFWSIISAAFIGPGTVTTAASAGAVFKLDLVWILLVATASCLLLQEACARISIVSGKTIGEAIATKFGSRRWEWILGIAIILGCAAYEAGNMLGAASGLSLIVSGYENAFVFFLFSISVLLLWRGSIQVITRVLGLVVALMGVLFISLLFNLEYTDPVTIPTIPSGSNLLVIGLLGTTIVPYNLFLGSGISKGQSLGEMRYGLSIAILIGGAISIAILIVSSTVDGPFTFQKVVQSIINLSSPAFGAFFAIGLLAAGASSALTAPLAAAITARSLFAKNWTYTSTGFRMVWGSVLLFGFLIGVADVKVIPMIILAQAVNGLLLPFLAVLITILVNDSKLLARHTNAWWLNVFFLMVIFITCLVGFAGLQKAIQRIWADWEGVSQFWSASVAGIVAMLTVAIAVRSGKGH